MRAPTLFAIVLSLSAVAAFGDLDGMFPGGIDQPGIEYSKRPVRDHVAELNRRIQEGKVQFQFEPVSGYLRSVLRTLNVPVESQLLVFSKTSIQRPLINPRNPRAVYFNDSVAVAWVRGSQSMEIAAQDPQQGVIFYTLNQDRAAPPQFTRQDDCLICHDSFMTVGVPGMAVRSVFPDRDGQPMRQLDDYIPDHTSPMEHRWGGWYVTGKHGSMRHMGNAVAANPGQPMSMVTPATLNLESLEGKFDPEGYLSRHSDIVALLVFEHQMHMMNLFTRVGWEVRVAAQAGRRLHARVVRDTARELVDYLLFADEPKLTARIQGASGFSEKFAAMGPPDSQGRSLRQFDLEHRLMRYPCSYMIYTAAFDGLPAAARDAIYRRMWWILSGEAKGKKYQRLSLADRRAIVEILRETKKGLPVYFGPVTR
ncbi:MAG TPA: hypothetical protein VIX89_19725 [Bryobacteraceae bacterium]